MKNMWDIRYADKEFVYGTKPNEFFKTELLKLQSGKLLLPAEGEGRNAAFAALKGWDVKAFDQSKQGKIKASQLANDNNVTIDYIVTSIEEFQAPQDSFDCIALIYVHLPSEARKKMHQKILTFLKPGGKLILEGFSKDQLNFSTGGPKNETMLFSESMLRDDFKDLKHLTISQIKTVLDEGVLHDGKASVIRLVGEK